MKVFKGVVVSTNMEKTATVEVTHRWMHPLYKKTVKRTKKYLIHDEKNEAKEGDTVEFKEVKPISKRKRFALTKIV